MFFFLPAEINEKFRDISNRLDVDLRKITSSSKKQYRALNTFADNKSPQRHFFQRQIIDAANQFDYYANCEPYRAWSRLSLSTEQHFEYVISLHGYGHISNGILVASAFTYLKAPKEEGGTEPVSLKLAATDIFQFNYVESFESISRRFDGWLSESITLALAEWTKTLRS